MQLVRALVAVQRVVAEVARVQVVVPRAAPDGVVAAVAWAAAAEHAAVEEVVARLAGDPVGPITALDRVLPGAAADDVVTAVTETWSLPGPDAITPRRSCR